MESSGGLTLNSTSSITVDLAPEARGPKQVLKTLCKRKPKVGQDQIFFNALKDQFHTKAAFLRFNQIKKYMTEQITHANLKLLEPNHDTFDGRISIRNIFQARRGAASIFHPLINSVLVYGGVGPTKHFIEIENFLEDTIEFKVLDDRCLLKNVSAVKALERRPSIKQTANVRHPKASLNFKDQPTVHDPAHANKRFLTQGKDRFYHLMVPYKHFLVVYGGQNQDVGLAKNAYRSVHCEIFMYDLNSRLWQEV